MGRRGIVARRMAADRTLMLAACATALFAATVLAALVGYTGSVTREGLRTTLAEATFETAGASVVTHVPAGGLETARRQVDEALARIYRDVPRTVSMSVRSDSYTLPGQEKREHPDLTAFATYTGIERHARLTRGNWPGPGAARDGEVRAALPAAAARAMRADVGSVLTLRGRVDTGSVARVRVVGLFDVPDPDHYFWQGGDLVTTGVERLDYTTYGPLVVRPEVFAARFTGGSGADARFTAMPDLRGVGAGDLGPLGDRAARAEEVFRKVGGAGRYTVVTPLPELTGQVADAVRVARSTMLVPVIQLVLLAGAAWLLVARLLADHRRGEVALLRTRGLGMRQLAGLSLAEGLLLVLPAAVLGPLLARPLLRLAGHVPAVHASGLRLDSGPTAPLWITAAATALACAVALAVPTLRGANRTFVEAQAGIGRPRRGGLRGSGADLALLLVAGLAIWQLTRYGAGGADRGGGSGVDPFIVSGPALGLLAGGVLLLRLVPVTTRIAERVATRARGLVPVLGTRQVGRRLGHMGPVLLLVMTTAVGVLSVTTMATWRQSQTRQADFQAGADLRLTATGLAGSPSVLGQGGRFAALPGVTGATAVLRGDAGLGDGDATLLAADARALGRVLRVQPGLEDGLRLDRLAKARPAAPALTVPGRPERLLFDLRLSAGKGPGGDHRIAVTVVDARGLADRVTLPALAADGERHTLALDAADLAGPGGTPSYPLSVRAVHYAYAGNPPSKTLDLELLGVRGEGTGDAALPGGARWDVFADAGGEQGMGKPRLATGGDALARFTVPPPPRADDDAYTDFYSSASVHAVVAAGAPPSHAALDTDLLPQVPGVVSAELARAADAGAGDKVTVRTVAGRQPIEIVGVVPALPSLPAGEPGVLVDLPSLVGGRLAAEGADPETAAPGEWWASARGGRTGPAVRELSAHPAWGEVAADRAELRSRLRDAPLGAALQGALVLGFGAALAFAAVSLVVNAAVTAGERSREFAVLRALGVPPRQVTGMLAIEQAYLVALGLLGGALVGLVVARLAVPHIVLGVQAAEPYPPPGLVVRWPVVLAMLAGVAAVSGLVLPPVIRTLRRRGVGAGLRAGEDR